MPHPDAATILGTHARRFAYVRDDRWDADGFHATTDVPAGAIMPGRFTDEGAFVPSVPGSLTCASGVGSCGISTLGSMLDMAARFSVVHDRAGKKVVQGMAGQPVRLGTTGIAWPYHGGPEDPAMRDVSTLSAWIESYFSYLRCWQRGPTTAIARSFGGTALLEWVLCHGGALDLLVAVSPYMPAWTPTVFRDLGVKGRQLRREAWEWILALDGLPAGVSVDVEEMASLQAFVDRYGTMAIDDYWDRIRDRTQWEFPRALERRLAKMRARDPSIDDLWRADWRSFSPAQVAQRDVQARAARGDLPTPAGRIVILYGELDTQYPRGSPAVERPEISVRAFWQAMSIAFGIEARGVVAGHDPLSGPRADRSTVQYVYDVIRSIVMPQGI